jgi:hypothetical protein
MLPTSKSFFILSGAVSNDCSFWGFYLGRPFRMNAGDISVPKPASSLGPEKEDIWHPYGHQAAQEMLQDGIKNPTELICRQFVVLWEMISPVGHILYGLLVSFFTNLINTVIGTDALISLDMTCNDYATK